MSGKSKGESSSTQEGKTKSPSQPSGVFKEGVVTKVNDLRMLANTENSKMTYAVVRGRNSTVISLRNRKGFITVSIVTVTNKGVFSAFDIDLLPRVIEALIKLHDEVKKEGIRSGKVKYF